MLNQEKIFHATNKGMVFKFIFLYNIVEISTGRVLNENDPMEKEIKNLKAEILKLNKQNKQVEKRKKKLQSRANQEAEIT